MNYELTHDTIAKQVFQKASTEARTRRKVERYIGERYAAYQERGAQLTQDDVDYIWPYLEVVNCDEKALDFVKESKKQLGRRRRNRLIFLGIIAVVFAALALWAMFQQNNAEQREMQSQSMRTALSAKVALFEGNPTLAYKLADYVLKVNNDTSAISIATGIIKEIQASPLVREILHKDEITAMQFYKPSENYITTSKNTNDEAFMTASKDGEVRITSLLGNVLQSYQLGSQVVWAKLASQNQFVLAQIADDSIAVIDLNKQSVRRLYVGGKITTITYKEGINGFAVAVEKELLFWALQGGGRPVLRIPHVHDIRAITVAKISSKLNFFTSDSYGKTFRWNEHGELILTYPNYREKNIDELAVDAAGSMILFQTASGDFLMGIDGDTLFSEAGTKFNTSEIWVSYKSRFSESRAPVRIVSVKYDFNKAWVWNLTSETHYIDLQHVPKGGLYYADLSTDGKRFVIGSKENITSVIKLQDEKEPERYLFRFNNAAKWGVFAPNNDFFLSSDGSNEARLWLFNQDAFVQAKVDLPMDQLRSYYSNKISALTKKEKMSFGIRERK